MRRSTQSEMQKYYDTILNFAYEQNPVTVRGIYYHLTTLGLIPKTQNGYQRVARYCKSLRLSGEMPYEWISDSTRWQRKPTTYKSIHEALDHTAKYYRRDLLSWIGKTIEIWFEKDALAGVVYPVTCAESM
ncbi:MAG: hypothetical protein OXI24_12155 [Candidatus Poribacteria bacterium]|nr:hypothetical protein [Candidatus Poribacteria bacterium]